MTHHSIFYSPPFSDNRFWGGSTALIDRPSIADARYGAWFEARVKALIGQCPTNQTTYFFDPVSGSDANAGTASGAPKQTLGAAKVLATTGNCRILFKAGTEVISPTGMVFSGANVSAGIYGTGPNFLITTRDTAQACGASWTASGANCYSVSRSTACAGVMEKGRPENCYARTSSVYECQQVAGSYYHDTVGNRLYVHHYANTPLISGSATPVMWFFPANTSDGVTVVGSGNVKIENWDVHGFGASVAFSQNTTAGFHSLMGYTSVACFVNCNSFLNNSHCFSSTNGVSGGILVLAGCKMGGLTYTGVLSVAYADFGGQEHYSIDCHYTQGDILRLTAGVPSYAQGTSLSTGWLMHANVDANLANYGGAMRCKAWRGMQQIAEIGCASAVPAVTGAGADFLIRSVNIDNVFEANVPSARDSTFRPTDNYVNTTLPYQILGGNCVDGWSTAYLNCYYECRPQYVGSNVDALYAVQQIGGYHINGRFSVDLSRIEFPTGYGANMAGLVLTADNLKCTLHNCHIDILASPASNLGCGVVAWTVYGDGTMNQTYECPTKFQAFETIVTVENPVKTQAYVAWGNNRTQSNGGGPVNSPTRVANCVTNCGSSTLVYKGTHLCDNTRYIGAWSLANRPLTGQIDVTPTPVMGNTTLQYDFDWRYRRTTVSAAGPTEAS